MKVFSLALLCVTGGFLANIAGGNEGWNALTAVSLVGYAAYPSLLATAVRLSQGDDRPRALENYALATVGLVAVLMVLIPGAADALATAGFAIIAGLFVVSSVYALREHRRVVRPAALVIATITAVVAGFFVASVMPSVFGNRAGAEGTEFSLTVAFIGVNLALVASALAFVLLTLMKLVDSLEMLSQRDPLTGILNRRGLDQRTAIPTLDRTLSFRVGVLAVDIDHFKAVNDTFGHAVGDEVLVWTAQALAKTVRNSDHVARVGGEEFVVVVHSCSCVIKLIELAERARSAIAGEPFIASTGDRIPVTISVGVATLRDEEVDLARVIQRADIQLYRAKHDERNQVAVQP